MVGRADDIGCCPTSTRSAATLSLRGKPANEWRATWSFTEPRPEELDADLLIVWMARHIDRMPRATLESG